MWVDVNVSEEDTVFSLTGHFTLLTNTNDQDRKSRHRDSSHESSRDRLITIVNINTLDGFTLGGLWNLLMSILKERRYIL
jgi:hypothetical protein